MFISANVDSISPRRQLVYPIESTEVAITGTKDEEYPVVQVGDAVERPVGCKVAKATVIPLMSQVPEMVRVLSSGLQIAEMHPHLMKRKLTMVAQGKCEANPNKHFDVLIANWSMWSVTSLKHMLVAQCTSCPNIM